MEKSSKEIISDIETAGRRLRYFQLGGIFLVIILQVFIAAQNISTNKQTIVTNQQLAQSVKEQREQSVRNTQERTKQLEKIQEYNENQNNVVFCLAEKLAAGQEDFSICKETKVKE